MHTPICDELGIEFPIFAFTHCRDVVVAVAKAGGFGVLGAVGFSPEQLEIELNWIDEHIGDHPYGVDIVIPNKYEGMDTDMSGDELAEMLRKMVPTGHLEFARKLLLDHGVALPDPGQDNSLQLLGWTEATATPQVEVALQHEKVTLIANALGTPPVEIIKMIHDRGRKVAALCGSPRQALKHAEADVDIIITQGGEGGGHCREVGSTGCAVLFEVGQRSRVRRLRDPRLVHLQRFGHRVHRSGIALAERLDRVIQLTAARRVSQQSALRFAARGSGPARRLAL